MIRKLLFVGVCLAGVAAMAFAGGAREEARPDYPMELEMWIGLGGDLGQRIEEMAADFNSSQDKYIINVVEQGDYEEAMTSAIAAYRAGNQPHILQVYEVGTGTFMGSRQVIKPVYELMAEAGMPMNKADYLSQVTSYYSDLEGNMLSFPFNSSTPIFYYNVEAFRAAGLDPHDPPSTWPEVAEAAKKLMATGNYSAGFTFQWPSWTQMENFSAWHNLPLGTKANGMLGWDSELVFNDEVRVRHLQQLADWQKEGIFQYGGRRGDATPLFTSGDVPMYIASSAAYAGIARTANFEFSAGFLPYWPDVAGAPQNSIIGGGSLWVMGGHSDAEYRGIAEFFAYLSSAEVQAEWHQFSGYLPVTYAAWELSREQGFYDKIPIHNTAIAQITLNPPTDHSRGLRFGMFPQIRNVILDGMEAALTGEMTAQRALDQAVSRGNALLREFERTVR
ncbi:glycerol-3-phosphate ABC transporter substrate-binding protein [Alkalispirochaeta sphaeroplastigenens]|uniref:sn-glycerol-3-phosphate-binding periplasmic protein UgpB n=1 Tax=Alkalispirochaeta sphaeroplastigenens TaxID=1187066 RepID=A0A2S4JMG6_9SPIO|nr:sn-glycerol-3-phosphate ABC transporter substrate-binding protein UgpB [Alkalispirochaeta sphaeroplastigenens]POR00673.1 glycerol-3-phosphate ABC transporter substrate-binding protein [Alkalispirochaeta sphaeroplastigenens]